MAINSIDTIRHVKVFDPVKFGDTQIDIIGAGATGSRIALSLAKLGVSNIHVWDFDKVEPHNIANQAFSQKDIGKFKVDAVADLIKDATGLEITKHNEPATGRSAFGKVVFLLVDSMAARKEIWDGAIEYNPNIEVMIETRMGAYQGKIYTVRPTIPQECEFWGNAWYPDDKAEVSECGTSVSVGPTAELVSGYAVWQFMRWFNYYTTGKFPAFGELVFMMQPKVNVSIISA